MADAAQSHYPWLPARYLVKDRFETIMKIAHVDTFVLVLHGEADHIVPFSHGIAVFGAAREPKYEKWFQGGGHSDLYDFGAGDIVGSFIEELK